MTADKPMRVLHVLKCYRPEFTGEGVFLERSSAVMHELAPEVEHELLVTHTPQPEDVRDAAACSTLRRVVYMSPRPLGVWRQHLSMAWWLLLHVRRYETVHFRTHTDWYFVSYLLVRLAGRRLVLSATLDDSLPVLVRQYRPSLRGLAARGFALFHNFISISPKLYSETRSMADPARCHLIPCGVTVPASLRGARARLREELAIGQDDQVLLFVGGLCGRKDPLFLVRMLPALLVQHPHTRLVLVGPPLEADHVALIQAEIAAHHLEKQVFLLGERADPHPCFAAADILVFASHLEGFGTVVPEAMAHGLPVVVRRLAGVNEGIVQDGESGFLFETAVEYLGAVSRLLTDPALRARMGAIGRRIAAERFGMRGVAARYLAVYRPTVAAPALLARGADATTEEPGQEAGQETGLGCTASVMDRRFHTPFSPPPGMRPLLITMVDAEEAFDWSLPFTRDAQDVTSMAVQHRAHRVFERHGVVPLYLVDYPVVDQEAGRAPLRELLRDGLCEIGAHMHPWVTPPFTETLGERNSYAGNLPVALELAKARRLTDALADGFGVAPQIYRTGRFGAGPRTADILSSLGYLADTSVTPFWPAEGLGDALTLSPRPYWLDRDRKLLEIPVSAALVGRLAKTGLARVAPYVFEPRMRRFRLGGVLAHLGLLERIRISPEGMTIEEAKRLARYMLADGHRVFVLTYHSPSLALGNTPYVRDAAQLARFLAWLDEFYAFFREELNGRFGSWRDVRGVPSPARRVAAEAMDET